MKTKRPALEPEYYTSSQVCDMLQISRRTLTRMLKRGLIQSRTIGHDLRFTREDIERAMQPRTD